jgi:hypothetical protein
MEPRRAAVDSMISVWTDWQRSMWDEWQRSLWRRDLSPGDDGASKATRALDASRQMLAFTSDSWLTGLKSLTDASWFVNQVYLQSAMTANDIQRATTRTFLQRAGRDRQGTSPATPKAVPAPPDQAAVRRDQDINIQCESKAA